MSKPKAWWQKMAYQRNNNDEYVKKLISERESQLKSSYTKSRAYLSSKEYYKLNQEGKIEYLNTKDGLTLIEGMSKDKLSFVQIASCLEMSQKDFHQVARDNPEIYDAIDRGRSNSIDEIETALDKCAKGFFVTETRNKTFINERGREATQTESYEKYVYPNFAAQSYILNNKRQEEWRNKQEQEEITKNTIRLEIEIIGDDSLNLE